MSLTIGTDRTQHYGSQPPVTGAAAPPGTPTAAVQAQAQAQPEPETNTDLPRGTMVGEYQVEHKLGEGGMGAVYAATHPLIGKKAAIKVISPALCTDPSAMERFVQEARSVNQIGHVNIVDVFAFGELADGRSYFVMEWLQGESLGERVARGRLTLGEAIEILDQVCDALEAAHEKQIVHRDLKPDNVFLMNVRGGRQMVKLLDFGIAKLTGTGDAIQKTRTGMMMGTPGYISPEQARGKNVDFRTDIYALGAMAYEMILGRLPFEADNAMDIVMKHLTEAPPVPSSIWPEIPAGLEQAMQAMLAKDPAHRPSLGQVRAVLGELRGSILQAMGPAASSGYPSGYGPRLMTPPAGIPIRPTPPPMQGPVTPMPQPSPALETVPPVAKKSSKGVVLALVGVVLVGGGIAAAMALRGGGEGDEQAAAATKPAEPEPKAPVAPEPPPVKPAEPPVKPPVTPPDPPPAAAPGTVIVKVNVDDARIELDGKVVAEKADGAKIGVDQPGDHELVVTAPGRKAFTKKVTVAAGATVNVEVKLERERTSSGGGGKKPPAGGDGGGKKPPGGCTDCTIDPFGNKKPR